MNDNQTIRDTLLKTINEQIQIPSKFFKVKILYFEKYEIEKDDKLLYDCNCYIFLDLNIRLKTIIFYWWSYR